MEQPTGASGNAPPVESTADYVRLLDVMLNTPDNAERKTAEAGILHALRDPGTSRFLVDILQDMAGVRPGIRQLACVLLRKRILTLFRVLSKELQEQLKTILLYQLAVETERNVRLAVAHCVCTLARTEIAQGWPALHDALGQAAASPEVSHRELAMILCHSLAEQLDEAPQEFVCAITDAVVVCLKDSVSEIRVSALKAVGKLLPLLHGRRSAQREMLNAVVPLALEVARQHIMSSDSISLVITTLDVLEEISEMRATVTAQFIDEVVEFLLNTALTREVHLRIREQSCNVIGLIATNKPKLVVRRKMLPQFVDAALALLTEEETITFEKQEDCIEDTEDADDADLEDVQPPCMFGGRLLMSIADAIPSRHVMPLINHYVTQVCSRGADAEPLRKKGAILALACASQGCSSSLRRQLSAVLAFTQQLSEDAVPFVREAAAFALSYFCEYLQPEVLLHHAQLIPLLAARLGDDSDNVRQKAARTLDALCENVGGDLDAYLPVLIPRLIEIIPSSSYATQKTICSALSSVAQAQCESFPEYATQILELLRGPLDTTEPRAMSLRAVATECSGVIAAAIGKDAFAPHFEFFFTRVLDSLQCPSAVVKEHAFGFFSNMCEILGRDWVNYMEAVMPHIQKAIEEDTAVYQNKHPLAGTDYKLASDSDEESSEEDNANERPGNVEVHMRVRTADVEEKSGAIYAVGVFAEKLQDLFAPWATDCEHSVAAYVDHFNDTVRQNAIDTMAKICISRAGSIPFEKTIGYPKEDTMSPELRESVCRLLVSTLLPTIAGETSKSVVAQACDSMSDVVEKFGAQAVHLYIEDIVRQCGVLLQQKGACHEKDEDDGDGEEGGRLQEEDHDRVLVVAVMDLVDALAEAYGPDFAPYFSVLLKDILAYCRRDRPAEDHAVASGTLANCIKALRQAATPLFDQALEIALTIMRETDEASAKSNCAFLIRCLVESVTPRVTHDVVSAMLEALWDVVSCTDEIPGAVDNAISAACSILRLLPGDMVPQSQLLTAILQNVPMKVDKSENENAANTIAAIFTSSSSLLQSHLPALVECVGRFLASSTVDSQHKNVLANALQTFSSSSPAAQDAVRAAVQQVPQRFQKALRNYVF